MAAKNGLKLADESAPAPVVRRAENGTLRAAADEYLDEIRRHRRPRTYAAYACALNTFVTGCGLRGGLNQTTVYHRFSMLLTFLMKNGIDVTLPKGERPKPRVLSKDGTDIETYSDIDIRKLLAMCRDELDRLIVLVASESGMRRAEVAHLEREHIRRHDRRAGGENEIRFHYEEMEGSHGRRAKLAHRQAPRLRGHTSSQADALVPEQERATVRQGAERLGESPLPQRQGQGATDDERRASAVPRLPQLRSHQTLARGPHDLRGDGVARWAASSRCGAKP